jgi:type VII secretion integral membrane protein EccD
MPLAEMFTRLSVMVSAGPQTEAAAAESGRRPGRDRTAAPAIASSRVDVMLIKDMPMAEATAELLAFLKQTFADAAGDQYDPIRARLADPWAYWQLVSPSGHHYPGDQLLSQTGLKDGAVVALVDSGQRENYRPLIDDAAEAIAHDQRQNFGDWTSTNSRALASVVTPLAGLGVVLAVLLGVGLGALSTVGQIVASAVLLFVAILALVGASTAVSGEPDDDGERVLAGLITTGYIFVAGAGLIAVPGQISTWSLLLAGGLLACAGWVVSKVIGFPDAVNYAAQIVGVIAVIVAGLSLAVDGSALGTSLGVAVLTMVFVAVSSSRLALSGSKIPLPDVPAQGETFLRDVDDLQSFDNASRNEVIASIVNREEQSIAARGILVGSVWGAVVLLVISAAVTGYLGMAGTATQAWCVLVTWLAIVLGVLFRGKASGDAAQQGSWLAGGFLIGLAFLIGAATSGERIELVLAGAAMLMAGAAIGTWTAVKGKVVKAPDRQRMLEFVEFLCFMAPPVLWAVAVGLFGAVRGML